MVTCPVCFGSGDGEVLSSGMDTEGVPFAVKARCVGCNGKGRVVSEREARIMAEQFTRFRKQGYSRDRAAELATWELHVRMGGD